MKLIKIGNINFYELFFSYVHYLINNIATTMIKTTNAHTVPPTATGVTFDSRFKWSALISKKKRKDVNSLERLQNDRE